MGLECYCYRELEVAGKRMCQMFISLSFTTKMVGNNMLKRFCLLNNTMNANAETHT